MNKPELLAPAGNLEILKIAFAYGADAVYCGTPKFAMRARVGFDLETLAEGIKYAHSQNKKVYLTLNAFPHATEIADFEPHLKKLIKLKPDAFIVADPGLVNFVLKNSKIPVHLSTQASTTNHLAAKFWLDQGVERIVLARELNLKDIALIHEKLPEMQIETFVHGAMCMAYSGRCQISNYLVGRDPNKGECVQACRFKYKVYGLEEDLRKGEIFPIAEDEEGTHILNSKDLCMIEHLPELLKAGVCSLKIEGRLKTEYYVAAVIRAYRKAIDMYFENPEQYEAEKENFKAEIEKTANRGFTTGFYFEKPDQNTNNYDSSRAASTWGYIGQVLEYSEANKALKFLAKNHLPIGSTVEVITPSQTFPIKIESMKIANKDVAVAHANSIVEIPFEYIVPINSFLRIKL